MPGWNTRSPRINRRCDQPGPPPLAQRVTIALRLLTPDGRDRAFELHDDPGVVRLDPRWHQAAARFVRSGFGHILDGIDHLLFLLCLVIPVRRIRTLVLVVTSFTVAHSITLIASAYNMAPGALWFPPLVETLIAASIVYMALENIVGANDAPLDHHVCVRAGARLRVFVCASRFAAVCGLAPADGAAVVQPRRRAGQLVVLAAVVPALNLMFRFVVAERMGTIILSAIVAHTAWHWLTERGAQLLQFPWPALDADAAVDGGPMDDRDRRACGGDLGCASAGQTQGRLSGPQRRRVSVRLKPDTTPSARRVGRSAAYESKIVASGVEPD